MQFGNTVHEFIIRPGYISKLYYLGQSFSTWAMLLVGWWGEGGLCEIILRFIRAWDLLEVCRKVCEQVCQQFTDYQAVRNCLSVPSQSRKSPQIFLCLCLGSVNISWINDGERLTTYDISPFKIQFPSQQAVCNSPKLVCKSVPSHQPVSCLNTDSRTDISSRLKIWMNIYMEMIGLCNISRPRIRSLRSLLDYFFSQLALRPFLSWSHGFCRCFLFFPR